VHQGPTTLIWQSHCELLPRQARSSPLIDVAEKRAVNTCPRGEQKRKGGEGDDTDGEEFDEKKELRGRAGQGGDEKKKE
jgi:hypothetical protein